VTAQPLPLRTWLFLRGLGSGDVVVAPIAAPELASIGAREDAILEQRLAIPEHLVAGPAALVARFAFPEGTSFRPIEVEIPRADLVGLRRPPPPVPVTIACVVVPGARSTSRPNEREIRLRHEAWIFVLPLREIVHFALDVRFPASADGSEADEREAARLVDDGIERRAVREIRRLWLARVADPFDVLGLLPARREELLPIDLAIPRGEAEAGRARGLRRAIQEKEKRARAVAILNDVGRPLHVARAHWSGDPRPLLGRARERTLLGALLSSRREGDRQGVVLIGRERVGKSALVEDWIDHALARGEAPLCWSTSGAALVAGMSGLGQWQERIRRVLEAAAELDAVLVIDDLADLFSERGKSAIDVPSAIRPFLDQGRVRLVAEVHEDAVERFERANAGFFAALSKVRLPPLDAATSLDALRARADWDARHARPALVIDDDALATIVELAERHLAYESFPGKAVRLYDETRTAAIAGRSSPPPIDAALVHDVVSLRTGIPTFLLRDDRALSVDEIAARLRARIVGQEEAVRRVAEIVTVVKARLQPGGKPLATFLFAGPTGVGKTELARALGDLLFGAAGRIGEDRLLRFDMSEFMDPGAAERLIHGDDRGEGLLTRAIRKQPFAVLLLDEIEKAHPRVLDLLLQLTGEGRLTDAAGRTAWFHDAIVILTTNLGAIGLRDGGPSGGIGFEPASGRAAGDLAGHYERAVRAAFRPEMVNRLDRIVAFEALGREHVGRLVEIGIEKIRRRRGLLEGGQGLVVSAAAVERLGRDGHDPRYGARALRRHLEEALVAPIARLLSAHGHPSDVDVDVRILDEPEIPAANRSATEVRGALRLSLVRRSARAIFRDDAAIRTISTLRRELALAARLDRIVELREQIRLLVAQLGTVPDDRFGRELRDHERLQSEHHRLEALVSVVDRALEDLEAIEETALEAYFRGEPLVDFAGEAESIRARVTRPLVRALIAKEPHRREILLRVAELDEGRALDAWFPALLRAAEGRWQIAVHLAHDAAPTWPRDRRWGPPRAPEALVARLDERERKPASALVAATGEDALLLALEAGVQRFVRCAAPVTDLFVETIALRTALAPKDWAKIVVEPASQIAMRAGRRPSRTHDEESASVTLADLGRVDQARPFAAFDEIARRLLVGFERGIGARDEILRGLLGDTEEILAIVDAHGKIEAIKRYRDLTGVGLVAAKRAVERMIANAGKGDR
jgi:ATP-dependent Clp protease ATP-binding subunit ClpC